MPNVKYGQILIGVQEKMGATLWLDEMATAGCWSSADDIANTATRIAANNMFTVVIHLKLNTDHEQTFA